MIPCELFASISPSLISEEKRNISRLWPSQRWNSDSEKYITEQMLKWMVEYLDKFQGRSFKIDRVNLTLVDNHWFSSITHVPVLGKWRHHELSFPFRCACIYLSLVSIPCSKYLPKWSRELNPSLFSSMEKSSLV